MCSNEYVRLFSSENEKRLIHLMLCLSNNSIVHTLNCLNTSDEEWKLDMFEYQEEERVEKEMDVFLENNKYEPDTKDEHTKQEIFTKYTELKN